MGFFFYFGNIFIEGNLRKIGLVGEHKDVKYTYNQAGQRLETRRFLTPDADYAEEYLMNIWAEKSKLNEPYCDQTEDMTSPDIHTV